MTKRRGLVLWLVVSGLISSSLGISVKTVNLEEMVNYSGRVFYGRCLSAQTSQHPQMGISMKTYRFRVLEALKGVETGDIVEVRQVSGRTIPGIPEYRKGQEILLFLHPDSRKGLTSPVGLEQGIFRVETTFDGEPAFVNSLQNRNLVHQLAAESSARAGLSADQVTRIVSGQPIPLSVLRGAVENLDEEEAQLKEGVE